MQRSGITRKLRPARTALGKLAAALRLGGSRLRPSKAFKRTATEFGVGFTAILGGGRYRRSRRGPTRLLLKSRSTSRLPSDQGQLVLSKLPAPQSHDDEEILDKPTITAPIELNVAAGMSAGAAEAGEREPRLIDANTAKENPAVMDQLEGIDLRAELFIAKIREQMRREVQRSSTDDRQQSPTP